jgi:peptide/nickel transport system substrate-binding protein
MHTAPLRRRSGIALAAISLVAALGLSACAPAEPAGEPQANDAVMSVAIAAAPPSFDPAQLDEGPGTFVWSSLYETLLFVDNDGSIQPGAAESYEYSEDRTTLTLKLREGLTFSNGDPVTSADVVATLERTKATPGPQQSRFADVASFTAEDDSTIVIVLNAPNASFLNFLAQAAGVVGHAATIDDEDSALRPVGSGPYVLSDTTIDGTTYVLERREDYWNAEAYPFKTFTVRVISDATALVTALSTGEVLGGPVDQGGHVGRDDDAAAGGPRRSGATRSRGCASSPGDQPRVRPGSDRRGGLQRLCPSDRPVVQPQRRSVQ